MRMTRDLLRSFPGRVVALSFIGLILLGNCWFVLTVVGRPIPAWFRTVSNLTIAGVLGGASWLAVLAVKRRLHRGQRPGP